MNLTPLTAALCGFVMVGCASAHEPTYVAAGWKLNPRLCPDLVEDYYDRRESRRDERVDYSRRDVIEDRLDRRESRRDESVTICPRSAWTYTGKARYRPARPGTVRIYWDAHKRHYYRFGPKNVRIRVTL